jgi:hypothetical protein
MKSKLLGAIFAAALPAAFVAGSANAVTFDVTGQNASDQTVTGTIDANATLTVINAINLQISGQPVNPFNVIVSPFTPASQHTEQKLIVISTSPLVLDTVNVTVNDPAVLNATTTPAGFVANIKLYFFSPDADRAQLDFLLLKQNFATDSLSVITAFLAASQACALAGLNGNGIDPACTAKANADHQAAMDALSAEYDPQFIATVVAETSATPLPAALPLFAGGAVVIGLLARRRKQKQVA